MQHNATLSIVGVTIKLPLCADMIEAACEKPEATTESRTRPGIPVQALSQTPSLQAAFVPFGMEAYGRLGPAASKFLHGLWDPC